MAARVRVRGRAGSPGGFSFREDLAYAARCGNLIGVQYILRHPRADAVVRYGFALQDAVCMGHVAVVKLFLADGRADPSAFDDLALREAAESAGKAAILQLLLADGRADPASVMSTRCAPDVWCALQTAVRWRRRRHWLRVRTGTSARAEAAE
jgi:hypothetical protein